MQVGLLVAGTVGVVLRRRLVDGEPDARLVLREQELVRDPHVGGVRHELRVRRLASEGRGHRAPRDQNREQQGPDDGRAHQRRPITPPATIAAELTSASQMPQLSDSETKALDAPGWSTIRKSTTSAATTPAAATWRPSTSIGAFASASQTSAPTNAAAARSRSTTLSVFSVSCAVTVPSGWPASALKRDPTVSAAAWSVALPYCCATLLIACCA